MILNFREIPRISIKIGAKNFDFSKQIFDRQLKRADARPATELLNVAMSIEARRTNGSGLEFGPSRQMTPTLFCFSDRRIFFGVTFFFCVRARFCDCARRPRQSCSCSRAKLGPSNFSQQRGRRVESTLRRTSARTREPFGLFHVVNSFAQEELNA